MGIFKGILKPLLRRCNRVTTDALYSLRIASINKYELRYSWRKALEAHVRSRPSVNCNLNSCEIPRSAREDVLSSRNPIRIQYYKIIFFKIPFQLQ